MTPEQEQALKEHLQAIAKILYDESDPATMQTLEGIEMTLRQQFQTHVSPEIGKFFIQTITGTQVGKSRSLKSTLGALEITTKQAEKLEVLPSRQLSPHLENCCMRLSATGSYEQAEQDVAYLTGIRVPAKTQQRLVHRQTFQLPDVEQPIEELSVDGGKVRLRTPLGQECGWRDYKAIATDQGMLANFQNNAQLIDWVNEQPLAQPVVCLGDGHDGIWNIISQIASAGQRREILDWYHLVENLHKVGGSIKRLHQAEALLWQGQVEAAMALFSNCQRKQAKNFCQYLRNHHHRIVNYKYFQAEGLYSIGSGAVESAIKQIGRRVQLSGAQWNRENVPQVLAHRCAYLNGLIGSLLPNP
ncbi:ISKra4 family transposase [Chroococcidiopsis sp. CCMEE 29]|uniref:ISKra4 family transposase n=1 Tax=Chroococcidiopsis sp. CCMEE 29 TaxID=155894 RepID=UPI0020218690|nr:ISKra4 family transposase [Chroococcidiopsis sp. CCMEE 29]